MSVKAKCDNCGGQDVFGSLREASGSNLMCDHCNHKMTIFKPHPVYFRVKVYVIVEDLGNSVAVRWVIGSKRGAKLAVKWLAVLEFKDEEFSIEYVGDDPIHVYVKCGDRRKEFAIIKSELLPKGGEGLESIEMCLKERDRKLATKG